MKKAFFVSCLASGIQAMQLDATTSVYADLLAEMKVNTKYESCKVTADRTKVGADNLAEMESHKTSKSQWPWTDPAFPHDVNALFWQGVDKPPSRSMFADKNITTKIFFKRLSEDPQLK